jgi:hypothetical protein
MATVKYTDAGQDRRLERLKSLRETRKDLNDLQGLKISPEWAKLVRLLRRWSEYATREEKLANAEHDSGDIDAATFSRLVTRARQKISDFDFIADILDKTKDQIDLVDSEISNLEKTIKEAKETLA